MKWINKKWINKEGLIAAALLLCVVTPLILSYSQNRGRSNVKNAQYKVNIITPHNETIRREFGEAFQDWWKKKTGETVYVNWLTPGGTSEIRMVLDSRFKAAKKNGDEGVGIDLLFGGGDYIFRQQAKKKRFISLNVFKSHPNWFSNKVIPQTFSGETYYDKNHQWAGVCLSRFGICYNVDVLRRRGLPVPRQWSDLTDPRYQSGIALADPTKSGSVARAFEMLIQQQIHNVLATSSRKPGETSEQYEMRVRSEGWDKGLNLIQKIAANTRYFTDSSTKIPRDVAQGDAVAGMCVDFYGLTYEEMLKKEDGSSRLRWVAPEGGTSMSVDPVAVFQGAPNKKIAQGFVEFLLSKEGQLLWNTKVGHPHGPKHRSLRRFPIRKDVYISQYTKNFTDPINPYKETEGFIYKREWTNDGFRALGFIIRVMCLDVHDELKSAWRSLLAAGVPERANYIFSDLTVVSYQNAMGGIRRALESDRKMSSEKMAMRLRYFFRKNYQQAKKLANKNKK